MTEQDLTEELVYALKYLLEQTVEMDEKYDIELTEGEADARDVAMAAINRFNKEKSSANSSSI